MAAGLVFRVTVVSISMPVYQYTAVSEDQQRSKGVIDSDTPRQARERLRDMGLRVVSIEQAQSQPKSTLGSLPSFIRPSWDHWVAGFTGELATLLSVGVPLMESLETLAAQYRGKPVAVVLQLKDAIASGQSLANAMKDRPQIFDVLCVKMVEVGENAGNLDEVLRQVADFKQRSMAFKDRVLSAMLYPMILLSVSIAVSVFLMTVVVPMLLENLQDSGRELPWPTLVLKAVSEFLGNYGLVLLVIVAALVTAVFIALRYHQGRRIRDQVLLKVPLLGKMSQQQEISRVALVIATLLKSGVKFVPAVQIAVGTSKNELLKESLEQCARLVESGREIGSALQESPYFPPLVTQVFTVGQESGRLEEMLFRLSHDYDQRVESLSGRLSTVIEPALILFLSFFIGFIMFATLMPILEAGNVF